MINNYKGIEKMPNRVSYNWISVFLSSLYFANMVFSPLKVYFTEIPVVLPATFRSVGEFPDLNAPFDEILFGIQRYYTLASPQTLSDAHTSGYAFDSVNNVDILSSVLPADGPLSIEMIQGAPYFPQDLLESILNRQYTGRAWQLRFLFIETAVIGVWVERLPPNSDRLNLIFVPAHHSFAWRLFKLLFRCSFVFLTIWTGMKLYYVHVRQLKHALELHPIRSSSRVAHYLIIVGDPMSTILANRNICIAGIIETLLCTEYMAQACLRLAWAYIPGPIIVALLYIGNVVWYAYATLVAINWYLKRTGRSKWYDPANSVLLAAASYFFGGGCTYIQSNIPFFLNLYSWALNTLPSKDENDGHIYALDGVIPWFLFAFGMCFIPLQLNLVLNSITKFIKVYRSSRRAIRRISQEVSAMPISRRLSFTSRSSSIHPSPSSEFFKESKPNSHHHNNTRRRDHMSDFSFLFMKWLYANGYDVASILHGGSVYRLFRLNPVFRSQMTLDVSDSDCYVFGYGGRNQLIEITRITLKTNLDSKTLERWPTTTNHSPCAVGSMVVQENLNRGSISAMYCPSVEASQWIY